MSKIKLLTLYVLFTFSVGDGFDRKKFLADCDAAGIHLVANDDNNKTPHGYYMLGGRAPARTLDVFLFDDEAAAGTDGAPGRTALANRASLGDTLAGLVKANNH